MPSLQEALAGALVQRLREHADAADQQTALAHNDPSLGNIAHAAQTTVLGTLLGLPLEAAQTFAKAATGEIIQGGAALGLNRLGDQQANAGTMAAIQAAQQQQPDNRFLRDLATNENVAGVDRGNAIATGVTNATLDPTNIVGPLGKLAEAHRLTQVAQLLNAADRAQQLPFEALGAAIKGGRRLIGGDRTLSDAAAQRLAATFARTAEDVPVTGVNGGLPQRDLPQIGGTRQYGPGATPEAAADLLAQVRGEAAQTLPLDPNGQDYNRFAKLAGLPPVGPEITPDPSSLVMKNFSPFLAAKRLAEEQAAKNPPTPIRPGLPIPERNDVVGDWIGRESPLLGNGPGQIKKDDPLAILAADQLRGGYPLTDVGERAAQAVDTPASAIAEDVAPDLAAAMPTDRAGIVKGLANGPTNALNVVLRSLHNAVYPGGQADFAIPALTGVARKDLRTSALVNHPDGNAAEPYLDYLISRVQTDPKAAARLGQLDPELASGVAAIPANPTPIAQQKELVQALFGGGKFGAEMPEGSTLYDTARQAEQPATSYLNNSEPLDAMRALIVGGDEGKMGGYAPADAAFYARRLGVPEGDVPALLGQLVDEGTLGRLPDGSLGIKPAPSAPQTLGERARQGFDDLFSDAADDKLAALTPAAAWRTLMGGLGGGATGGIAGATQGDTPQERTENALKGALTGLVVGGSAGRAAPELGQLATTAGKAALDALPNSDNAWAKVLGNANDLGVADQQAANLAGKTESIGRTVLGAIKSLPQQWRSNTVTHPKNLLQDEGSGRIFLRGTQGGTASDLIAPIRTDMADRLKIADPWSREPSLVQDPLIAIGKRGYVPQLGDSLVQAENNLSKVQSSNQDALGSGILSAVAPTVGGLTPLGLAASATLGKFRPYIRGAFRGINEFQQASFRRAAFASELDTTLGIAADQLLPDLERVGVDVSKLDPGGQFSPTDLRKAVGAVAPDNLRAIVQGAGHDVAKLQPADIQRIAGDVIGDRWDTLSSTAVTLAEDRAKFIYGDYSKKSGLEKVLGGAIPFISWSYRAYPVVAEMAAQHPGVALAIYHLIDANSQGAGKDGRPGYTAGMIPVDKNTPLVGPIINAMLGGQPGAGYVDPIGAFSPVGGSLVQPAEQTTTPDNWYQSANKWLDRVGLPGANPAIQDIAYVLGLDYKSGPAMSRTQGGESSLALIPGNPQLPDLAGGALRAARANISPLAESIGVPGAKGDKYPTTYDPITRRYAELVLDQTGKSLDDPANRAYLVAMTDNNNPLVAQARREVLLGGAAKNAISLTSPVGAVVQGEDARANAAAKAGPRYSPEDVAATRAVSPGLAALYEKQNEKARATTPQANAYKVGSAVKGRQLLIADWDAQHAKLKAASKDEYDKRRAAYIATLGR